MGFSSSSSNSSRIYTPTPTPPPVVTQTAANDTKEAASQASAHKKGLLSTILSAQRRKENTSESHTGNSTLG